VLAGMIAVNQPFTFKTTTVYADSKLSKILKLVQEASAHKAPTELFIRKFARVYTPIVVFSAIAICLLPMLFLSTYHFNDWLYRSLVFLVVSCPCALVISIPLGYFGGIGAGSRNGILFKGSNYLDLIAKLDHLVTDKTGTITEGVFQVQEVKIADDFQQTRLLAAVNLLESHSNHPVAKAVHSYLGAYADDISLESIEEIAGHGLKAVFDGKPLLLGNFKLLNKFSISYPKDDENSVDTLVAIAYDGRYVGYLAIADKIKDDAKTAVDALTEMGIQVTMLSGDRTAVVDKVAKELGIAHAKGDLLPEDKVLEFQAIKQKSAVVGFVGDGINDAPVVALSDIGLAMGGLGSDATIETADIIIQDDNPLRIAMAVQIGKKTKQIVWQNIGFAFGVKLIVLLLGAGGLATLWEAVFADVGVALLAILNAVRIQRMKF
jgi:Cd2+/Zn2+-exporting ATPase